MRVVDLIRKKRFGQELLPDEIEFLVRGYAADAIPDYQMAAWLMAVCCRGMTLEETTTLTLAMAHSGATIGLAEVAARAVDKHSTGGVGDKTTLIVGPLVAAAGATVAKMSGRGLGFTGGTLDKLESIPRMRVDLTIAEFLGNLRAHGIAISGQTTELAPADGRLYALRDATATVESIPLIASSIMSKKIAAGAPSIVLDVKAGRGAFMKTVDEARVLAQTMLDIGTHAGLRVAAVISAADEPLGRAVGNALEVREAIAALRGEGPPDLAELCREIGALMLLQAGVTVGRTEALALLDSTWRSGRGLAKLGDLIEAQGGDPRVIESPEMLPRAPVVGGIAAPQAGWVVGLDAEEVGLTSAELGAGRQQKGDPIDPAVGVVLQAKIGDRVDAGSPLATIHAASAQSMRVAATRLLAAYTFSPVPTRAPAVILSTMR